ncbi:16S rRNA (uracil(1498)-N(3))-methyltransferase [Paenibacillus aquistagni]|uniref:Ribosomal RNA small subunit methyltransferase E n=1 Tax=Paenibacillus aquistagni TaxID=1852522 RepID=A0A1X7ICY9_9BACL|nr:16S rRNA (uracil(1498)-N(3))-methyltransferase [Paenibacillus aquistagni]NMM51530.1 16S rRNA (uracil(1498)-N(3))-methyltransferase [Paenibacillus aquistagni]SMG12313.1 16S rRNA (uracil1498-N3)-methyltransferase [Paenibacillus aquistagni]
MQKYFVAPEQFGEQYIEITGQDAHHITKVMRQKPGDAFIVSDGVSREALVQLDVIEDKAVRAIIVEHRTLDREPAMQVAIAQSLPKGDKMELIIQKCTEIGAVAFVPFVSERTVVQYDAKKEAKRMERWGKIAKEAAEQSHRNLVPSIERALSWKELLQSIEAYDLALFCYENEQGTELRDVARPFVERRLADNQRAARVLIIVGPEGGFASREVEEIMQAGAKCVGLGRRILRAETAGMLALGCLLYESGEMGGI